MAVNRVQLTQPGHRNGRQSAYGRAIKISRVLMTFPSDLAHVITALVQLNGGPRQRQARRSANRCA